MNKAKKTESWSDEQLQKYIDDYIAFINKWDIKYFFEMDLDCVIGYDRVKEIRQYIEEGTGKRVIPVWHITRGVEEFHEMCKNYKYVAIGGIASREIKKKQHNILFELAEVAHQYGCKIHGLGYLPIQILNDGDCPFDTVDGTSWQGHMRKKNYILKDNKLEKIDDTRYWKEVCYDCFDTWTKFSYIAE